MQFGDQTTVTDSDMRCNNMFLDLKDFATILNGSLDTRYLIDVIGQVMDFGGVDIVNHARKEVTKMVFYSKRWQLAEVLIQEQKQPNNGDICLIRYAKLNNYTHDELQVSNAFDSSLVMLNPAINEVEELKQMVHADDNSVNMYQHVGKIHNQSKRIKWSQFPFKTIQEMKHTDKDAKCRIICTVYAIDTLRGWYYCACVVCNRQVLKTRIVYDDMDSPSWYKLDLLVQDQTGESKITLQDPVATSIVKYSAAKIVNVLSDNGDPDVFTG
ncbi:uncharacterized protein LOC130496821 [Raphanus sativus]|uniref:Uncharacterized protein LOC130496821 n=1 Tax=Raphanus sativus TaxID=3726 RepID=A0A9W3C1I2_RAPSA|nr:uncharacterized protein LOC130496821 [Raphanus sativus]